MRTLTWLATSALLVVSACGGDDPSPQPTADPRLSQAEARDQIPIDGTAEAPISWGDSPANDAVDTLRQLIALEVVGRTFDPTLDPELVSAYSDPPLSDVSEALDPAESENPVLGDVRALALPVTSSSTTPADQPNVDGDFTVVGVCLDRSGQVGAGTSADAPGVLATRTYVLQQVEDVDGDTVWKVRESPAFSGADPAAFETFDTECARFFAAAGR